MNHYQKILDPKRQVNLLHDYNLFKYTQADIVEAIHAALPQPPPVGSTYTVVPSSKLATRLFVVSHSKIEVIPKETVSTEKAVPKEAVPTEAVPKQTVPKKAWSQRVVPIPRSNSQLLNDLHPSKYISKLVLLWFCYSR